MVNLKFIHSVSIGLSCLWIALALPVSAQSSGILVVDLERAYDSSKFAQAMRDAFNLQNQSLNEENNIILNALKEEELQLTQDRAILSPELFAAAADAFDYKVQGIRTARLQKLRLAEDQFKRLKINFFQRINPFFDEVMREYNAAANLEKKSIVRSVDAIDITDLLVQRVDQAFLANKAKTETPAKENE